MVIVGQIDRSKNWYLVPDINRVKFHQKNVLVPFSGPEFCALSFGKGLRLPGSQDYTKNLKKPVKSRTNNLKKRDFGRKWVGIGRNQEISMPIDAPRSGDLENRGFGQTFIQF